MDTESKDKIGENGGGQVMLPATKNVVQSLKEIVNCTGCTDQEIYDVLEECDMDPARAVERLLAQDAFREVKSKRERRKEMKEVIDSRSRRYNIDLSCGGKIGTERNVVHSGSTHGTCNELGKAADKGEVGSVCSSVTSSMTCVIGKDMASDSFRSDNGRQSLGSAGVSSRLQPTLPGVNRGHLSMADVVRMGKPSQDAVSPYHSKASGVSASVKPESSLSLHYSNQNGQQDFNCEWPVIEPPVVGNESHASKLSALSNANVPSDHFNLQSNTDSLLRNCVSGEAIAFQGNIASGNVDSDKNESGFPSSGHTIMNNAGLGSHSNYNLKNNYATDFQSSSEHHKDVSSAASGIKRLSLGDSKVEGLSTEDNAAVVLPNHVQGLSAKCSHLCFGRYNCGSNSTSSTMLASHVSKCGLEENTAAVDGGSLAHYFNSVYCGDKLLRCDVFSGAAIDRKYDFRSSFQQELVKRTSPEATLGHECTTMPSVLDPSFQKSQWVSNPLPFKRPGLQNGNVSTFSREMVMEPRFSLPHRSVPLQDLAVQSSLQLEPADKRGYHPLNQNQQYLAPIINAHQTSSGGSAYGHSPADMKYSHPQNRNEFIMSRSTPARGRDAFGYGNPGSYNPGSFLPSSSIGSMMPSSNLDETLPSQYNGGRNVGLIQQHDGFSTWNYGHELRSMSLPQSMRQSSLGQPSQAPLSQYITPGYSDLYHSETGTVAELKRQVGSQDLSSKQSHQFDNRVSNSLLPANILSPFFH